MKSWQTASHLPPGVGVFGWDLGGPRPRLSDTAWLSGKNSPKSRDPGSKAPGQRLKAVVVSWPFLTPGQVCWGAVTPKKIFLEISPEWIQEGRGVVQPTCLPNTHCSSYSQREVPPLLPVQRDRGGGIHEAHGARRDTLLLQGCLQPLRAWRLQGECPGLQLPGVVDDLLHFSRQSFRNSTWSRAGSQQALVCCLLHCGLSSLRVPLSHWQLGAPPETDPVPGCPSEALPHSCTLLGPGQLTFSQWPAMGLVGLGLCRNACCFLLLCV